MENSASDNYFLLNMGLIVFFMQAGFGLLEAGCVRAKNVTNILFKNYMDVAVAAVCYFSVGWAFANAGVGYNEGDPEATHANGFIGWGNFFLNDEKVNSQANHMASFFFQFAFAATAATIVSGAVAERVKFEAYLIYSAIITAFIYPIGAHWGWNEMGFLYKGVDVDKVNVNYVDYAGSGIVHIVGGTAALAGAFVTGPRLARSKGPIPGHNIAYQALGGFILMFGFFAFNGGSELAISSHRNSVNVAQAFVSTLLCGAGGILSSVILSRTLDSVWDLSVVINGSLTGMVAACAGCNQFRPYAALIVGLIAGVVYVGSAKLVEKLKIDDPLNAAAVHLGGGFWGVLAVALLGEKVGLFYGNGTEPAFGKVAFTQFGFNLLGALIYMAWAGSLSFGMFKVLDMCDLLRVPESVEHAGLDVSKHGGHGYFMAMEHDDDDCSPQGSDSKAVPQI